MILADLIHSVRSILTGAAKPRQTKLNIPMLSVARDFSRVPAGRDGATGGGAFRALLLERLVQSDGILVDFDGTVGYGSSWLNEAFSDLPPELAARIALRSVEDPSIVYEVEEYLGRRPPLPAAGVGTR